MGDVRVRLREPRLRKVAGVQFRPGIQRISREEWVSVQTHPVGAAMVNRGVLDELKSKAEVNEPERDPGDKLASELVADMPEVYDMAWLRQLAEDERVTVARAAKEQIEKIEAAAQ